MIKKKFVYGHWEIYVDGILYCTCEDGELSAVLEEVKMEINGRAETRSF